MSTTIILFLCGVLGIIYADVRKIISLRRKGSTINYKFTALDYLRMDWDIILSQFLSIVVAVICWKYFSEKEWAKYGEGIFITFGVIGTELLNTFWSRAEKHVIKMIKDFTNKADDGATPQLSGANDDGNDDVGGGTVGNPK